RGTEPVEFDWVRETARQIGTVAHRLLLQIAENGLDSWTAARVEAQRRRVARDLSALGFTGAEADAAVEQVLASIRKMLADARGRCAADPVGAVLPAPRRVARVAGTGLKSKPRRARGDDDAGPQARQNGKIEVF